MTVNGIALSVVGVGGLVLYSAIRGKSPLKTVQSVIQGTTPVGVGQSKPITLPADTSSSSGTGTETSGFVTSASGGAAPVISYLRNTKSKSIVFTAGVLGNFQVESNFNPGSANAAEGAIGLAQWEGGRRTALQQFASARGSSETDLATQLDFFWHELTGSYALTYAAMNVAPTPESVAAIMDSQYEKSSGSTRVNRTLAARSWYNTLHNSGTVAA